MRVRDEQPVYMLRLTRAELEAATWCVDTLSSSWLGAPDGTAIDGLKEKLSAVYVARSGAAVGALAKPSDIPG